MDIYTQIECRINGTEKEIEQADKKFKELAKDDEMFEALDNAKQVYGDSIYIYADPSRPIYADGMELEAIDIKDKLFAEFKDYEITLEGYHSKLIKKKGTSDYKEEFFPADLYAYLSCYKEDTNEIEAFEYPFDAYFCDLDVDIFRDENGIIEEGAEVETEKDGIEIIATFSGRGKIYETNVSLYNKESDSFSLVTSYGKEADIEVPGDIFKNEKGEYESKQVFFKDDNGDWLLVHLVMTDADKNQLNGTDQESKGETKPKVIRDLSEITTNDVCVEISYNIKKLEGLHDSEVFAKSRYALEKIIVDDKHHSYWTDGKAIFSKDKKTLYKFMAYNDKEYTIPDGTEVIFDNCFYNMDNLETVKLPSSIKKLGSRAFSECTKLNNIEGLEDIEHIEEFDGFCIDRIPFCDENEVIIIGNILFKNETKDEKVIKVPEGITEIFNFMPTDSTLFMPEEPDLLEEVILPSTLKKIDREAFVKRTNLKKIIIPNGVEEIGQGAFEDCFGLERINIPSTVKTIDTMFTFPKNSPWDEEDTPFKSIDVDPSNKNYCSIDGMLYSKDKKTMLHVPAKSFKEKIVIPKEVEVIASYCFDNYSDSTPIEISFEKGSQLKTIESEAFMDLVIDSVTIPEGMETICQEAFYRGEIKKVSLPKEIYSVEQFAFSRAEEIEIYDTMDLDCGDAYDIEVIDWDTPETEVPMMCARIDYDYNWNDHTITVKSAETDEIKYKVWMGAEGEDQEYQGILMFGWGHNATFAFKEQDAFFDKLEVEENKLKIAEYRLSYPIDLTEEMKDKYIEFLKEKGCDVDKILKNAKPVETEEKTENKEKTSKEKKTKSKKKTREETNENLWPIIESSYEGEELKAFKEDYEIAQKACDELLALFKELDCSRIKKPESYFKKIEKVEKEYSEKYKDHESYPISLISSSRTITIYVGLNRFVYWLNNNGGFYVPLTIILMGKEVKDSFDANKFHKGLCTSMTRSNNELLYKFINEEVELSNEDQNPCLINSKSYFDFVIKGTSFDNYYDDDDVSKGCELVKTTGKELENRIEKLTVGDPVTLKLEDADVENNKYTVAVETKDGIIGYLGSIQARYIGRALNEGIITTSCETTEVLPKSQRTDGGRKSIVKIMIEVEMT